MKLMNGERVVAYSICNDKGQPLKLVAVEGIAPADLPLVLFRHGAREVEYLEFLDWVKERCFPPNRVDCDKLLAELGLSQYDALDIVIKTGARLTFIDDFWVDWEVPHQGVTKFDGYSCYS